MKEKLEEQLKTARSMYATHKKNNTSCVDFWANECLRCIELLEAIDV